MATTQHTKEKGEILVSAFLRPNLAGNNRDTVKITIPKLAREITGISEKTPLQCKVDDKGRLIYEKISSDGLARIKRRY